MNRKSLRRAQGDWTDKGAEKISKAILSLQERFSVRMNRMVKGVSVMKLKIIVIGMAVVIGGYSLYLIVHAVKGGTGNVIKVDQVKVPVDNRNELDGVEVDSITYEIIQEFKRSDDYDSIIQARPGLLDSMLWLEQIYNHK